MYTSLKKWMNLRAIRKPVSSLTGAGTKIFAADVPFMCYAAGKVTVVTNSAGTEVVSNRQLYVDGAVEFDEQDEVVFEGKQLVIKAIAPFYRKGVLDMIVIYL